MKKLKLSIIIILSILSILFFSFVFNICPPSGPWIMPPWCESVNQSNTEKIEYNVIKNKSYNTTILENNKLDTTFNNKTNITSKTNITNNNKQEIIDNNKINIKNFMKGVTFGAMHWSEYDKTLIHENFRTLKEFNVEYIILIPEWFVFPNGDGDIIKPYYNFSSFPNKKGWIYPTLSDNEIKNIIKEAHENNIKVILKPHIDPIDFGINNSSSRGSLNPNNWNIWFENYKKFILHYAKISQEENLSLFVIGTELDTAIRNIPKEDWVKLINDVRKIYNGKLTYSVSCFGKCYSPSQVKFWDKLDYIGIEPYFGLSNKKDPSTEEMRLAFDKKFDLFVKPLYKKYNKPIIITEANIYSYDGANMHPIDPPDNKIVDYNEQSDYYEAMFESISKKDYIQGLFWWGWYLDSTSKDWNNKEDLYDPFVRKPAGKILKKWYNKINSN